MAKKKNLTSKLDVVANKLVFTPGPKRSIWNDAVMPDDYVSPVKIYDVEFGYTPNNLRYILLKHQVSRKEAAKLIGVTPNQFGRYCQNPRFDGDIAAVSMRQAVWQDLLNKLGYADGVTAREVQPTQEQHK